MKSDVELPGLDRLLSVCRAHHWRLDLNPPLDPSTLPQGRLSDRRLDSILVATLSRSNGATLAELGVFGVDETPYGLGPFNTRMSKHHEGALREVFLYGVLVGFPYYLATVPSLADENGIQPVLYVNLSVGIGVMPIASSVDKAFDLYARYLEAKTARDASLGARQFPSELGKRMTMQGFSFPRSVPEFVAQDEQLVRLLEGHRFAAFTAIDPHLPEWTASVLRARP